MPRASLPIASLLAATALAAMSLPAQATDSGDAASGAALARQICADCHAVRPGEIVSPKGAAPSFEDIARTPGLSPIALRVALRSSHREMPNLILNEDETERIVAYVLSLREAR